MDQEGHEATQGDNNSKEGTPEDTGEHKGTQGNDEQEKINVHEVDNKERAEEAEIQQAEPDGITKSREGEEELSGTSVDLEAGK